MKGHSLNYYMTVKTHIFEKLVTKLGNIFFFIIFEILSGVIGVLYYNIYYVYYNFSVCSLGILKSPLERASHL